MPDATVSVHDRARGDLSQASHPTLDQIERSHDALAAICRRCGVAKLKAFGSAARGAGFDSQRSDIDFLVTFEPPARNDLAAFQDLRESLGELFGRAVGLMEREAIEASRNFIRRRSILGGAQAVYD